MKNKKLSILIKISILAAMAFILYLFEVPIPIFPDFLKIDIGDVPALLGAFAMGPVAGILIELIKNILHFILKGGSAGIGELANFIVGAGFVATAGFLYKKGKSRRHAVTSLVAGTIAMGIVASIGNYFIFLPLYESILHFPISAVIQMAAKINSSIVDLNSLIIYTILPFNIIKGIVISIIVFLVYKRVSPILHK